MSGINSVTGRADINQVLAEMRNLRAQVRGPQDQGSDQLRVRALGGEFDPTKIQSSQSTSTFSDLLSSAVNSVNDTQMKSGELSKAFELGDPNVSLAQVMIQSQKASVSFQALTQVRNKVVQAYQDIMKMPV